MFQLQIINCLNEDRSTSLATQASSFQRPLVVVLFEYLDSTSTATTIHGVATIAMPMAKIGSKTDKLGGTPSKPRWSVELSARRSCKVSFSSKSNLVDHNAEGVHKLASKNI
jgi:hypothetical protein